MNYKNLSIQNLILSLFLSLIVTGTFSQKSFNAVANDIHRVYIPSKRPFKKAISSLNINYGIVQMDLKNLSTYLGINKYETNMEYWGMEFSRLNNRKYFNFNFTNFKNHIQDFNDSVKTELSGWGIHMNFGYDLLKSRKIDLIPMLGIGYQELKVEIKQDYINSTLDGINHVNYYMRNPAFMFDFGLELRVPFSGAIAFSIKGGYKLDVSNKKWKYEGDKINVESNIGGAYVQASICLGNFKQLMGNSRGRFAPADSPLE